MRIGESDEQRRVGLESAGCCEIDDAGSVVFTRKVILQDAQFELVETVDTLTLLRRRIES